MPDLQAADLAFGPALLLAAYNRVPADDKVMQAAEAKRQKKKKQDAEDDAYEEGEASMKRQGSVKDGGGAPTGTKRNRKASFALEGGDATVVVNARGGAASFTSKGAKVGVRAAEMC
jgi:hypothetical protein